MMRAQDIDQVIIHDLMAHGTCQVEDMVERLAGFTWNQVFSAHRPVEPRRDLALQRPARFGYEIIDHRRAEEACRKSGYIDEGSRRQC